MFSMCLCMCMYESEAKCQAQEEVTNFMQFFIFQVLALMPLLQRVVPDTPKDLSVPSLACEYHISRIILLLVNNEYTETGRVPGTWEMRNQNLSNE